MSLRAVIVQRGEDEYLDRREITGVEVTFNDKNPLKVMSIVPFVIHIWEE